MSRRNSHPPVLHSLENKYSPDHKDSEYPWLFISALEKEVFHLKVCIVQRSTVLKSVLNTLQIFMTRNVMPLVYNLQVSLKFCLKTNEASPKA